MSSLGRGGITILSARSDKGGHAMLVDGYQFAINTNPQKIYYHVNYGWGDGYNGYVLDIKNGIASKDEYPTWVDTEHRYPYRMIFYVLSRN